MMKTPILALLLIVATLAYNYPMYKQCDSKWASNQLGTSTNTICSAGCLMSSAAMALTGFGKVFTPATLNTWLTNNKGYVSGDLFVWASINVHGVTFRGFIDNSKIKQNIDNQNIVIMNVHNGGHWVLATGYSGNSINVNDPGYTTASYDLSQVVNGNTGLYTVNRMPSFVNSWLLTVENLVFGEDRRTSPEPKLHNENIKIE